MSDSDSDSEYRPLEEVPSSALSYKQKHGHGDAFEVDYSNPLVLPSLRPRKSAAASSYIDPDVQMELNAMMGSGDSNGHSVHQRNTSSARNGQSRRAPESRPSLDTVFTAKPVTPKAPSKTKPVDYAARMELEAILQKPALTAEDKYRVLDARDKLIRLTTATTTDISRVSTTRGVCPDMCPEKERLMREATHHVATFELEDNSRTLMRHTHALKQYARSSADQQISLAHELRPEPVLQMTMQFLLHNIVDLCESPETNLADWFHFVWDRTRSIRKDISQQDMCSIGAANLVEQCARLHIHCAGRLVAEEPQVFSSKINSENLTKCLQSLKYLYHDLQLRSISCSNEAEFRAYVVLLNLNDCQFFWEVKRLPPNILHSPQIQFAIKVYLALAANNYVRFFRLVRETTYMNACILMRYFTQIRVVALEMMLKTYSPRSTVSMDISHWQYVLAFEDFDQTVQFFEYYGLQCDREGDRVFLNRDSFIYPDIPFLLERAVYLVEHKRTCSVGESINGAPLADFELQFEKYEPHDSFDDRGLLYAEAWTAEDQNYSRPSTPKTRVTPSPVFRVTTPPQRSPSPRPPSPRPPPTASPTSVFKMPLVPPSKSPQSFTSFKLDKSPTLDKNSTPKFGSIFHNQSQADAGPRNSSVNRNIFGSSVFAEPTTTTKPAASGFKFALNLETTAPPDSQSKTQQPFSINFGTSTAQNIFGGTTKPDAMQDTFSFATARPAEPSIPNPIFARSLSKEEAQKQRLAKEAEARSQSLTTDLIEECLAEETIQIARQELDQYKAAQLAAIDAAANETLDDLIESQIQAELNDALQEMIREASQCNTAKYFYRWRQLVRQRIERRTRIENTPIWIEPERTRAEMSIPQHKLTLLERIRYRQGIAPAITLPKPKQDPIDVCAIVAAAKESMRKDLYWKCILSIPGDHPPEATRLYKWLSNSFQRRSKLQADVFFAEQILEHGRSTSVCMRLLQGSQLVDYSRGSPASLDLLKGSHAILFFETATESCSESQSRLARLQRLNLPIEHVPHPTTRQTTADLIRHMAQLTLVSIPSGLQIQRTTDFLLQTLGDQFWHTIRHSAANNPALEQIMRNPQSVVHIYNEAIRRLVEIAAEDHTSHPDFAPELRRFVPERQVDVPSTLEYFPVDWKDPSRSQRLVAFLKQLELKPPDNLVQSPTTAEALCTRIHAYCQSHSDKNIADQITSSLCSGLPSHLRSPDDIIVEFARIGPAMLSYARLSQQYNKHSNTIPTHIVYNASQLRHFCQQPWWLTFDESPVHTVRLDVSTDSHPSPTPSTAPQSSVPRIIHKSEMDALMARATAIIRNADTKIHQQRAQLGTVPPRTRPSDGATAQLDQTLRRLDMQVQRNKRIIADDDDLQAAAGPSQRARNNQNQAPNVALVASGSKKRRMSNASSMPSVADLSGIRSFVWQCYAK